MFTRHEVCHVFDSVRTFNQCVDRADLIMQLLIDKNLNDEVLNETFENLVNYVNLNCDKLKEVFAVIIQFISQHDTYDLTVYTDKSAFVINQARIFADTFSDNIKLELVKPQITDKKKLADIASKYSTASLIHAAPVTIYVGIAGDSQYHHANIINDCLDSSSYYCKGINYNSGQVIVPEPIESQKKQRVLDFMDKIDRRLSMVYFTGDILEEVNDMLSVRDWIRSNIELITPLEIAAYIDSNVPRVPYIRRASW